MDIKTINADDGTWSDIAEPQTWIRLYVGSTWFDVQERNGGLFVHASGQMTVRPVASNGVVLHDND